MFLNCYANSHALHRHEFLQKVYEFSQAQYDLPCVLVGDFNEEPSTDFGAAMELSGFTISWPRDGLGSRWDQKQPRIIDFVLASHHQVSTVWSRPERWSDHRALEFVCDLRPDFNPQVTRFELVPCNVYLPTDPSAFPQWSRLLESAWNQNKDSWQAAETRMRRILDDSSLDPQTKADLIWKDFNVFVKAFLLQTARLSPVSMRATRRAKRGKGTPAVFRQINQAVRKPYDNGAPNRLRVLYRLLGRMQELAFRRIRQQAIPSELQLKLQRCPSWTPQLTIAEVKQQISDLETHQRESRIRHWENRLRGSQKEVFAWLKRVKSPPTHMIFNDEGELGLGEPAAVSTQDALEKIKSFWSTVWDRERSQNEILPEDYFQLWDIPARNPECWAPVDTESIIKSARRQKHKSGGTDGWTGTEVSLSPSCMWRDIAVLFGWFEVLGHFPQIWGEVRQAHLMKSHAPRSSDGAVPASKMRPIAVMSVWYRMYTGALLRTSQAQDWINSVLDPVQHGCRQKHDCLQAVVPLASAQAQGHFIWSLDLSQAFDRLRPEVALRSLTHFGFPSLLANAFQKIWSSQRRALQWQGESFPVPCMRQVAFRRVIR